MNKAALIEKYFTNSLSPKEQDEFNRLLKEDSDFRDEFSFQKDLKDVLIQNQKKTLKKTLQHLESELNSDEKKRKYRFWMMAASIVLLIGLSFFFYQQYQQKLPENLFAANFQPYRNIVNPVVRGDKNETIEKRAFLAYENGDYYKAINLFSSVVPKSAYIDFYKAMSYMAVDKNMEAVELLTGLINTSADDDKFGLSEKAKWYLALAYLKINELEKSRELLRQITENGQSDFKKEAAKALLDDLN